MSPIDIYTTIPAHTFMFKQPDKHLTMNQRLHWAPKAQRTRAWREAAAWHTRVVSLRNLKPCLVRCTFGVTQPNRRRDAHNWAPTVKAIVDGMVDAGAWADDSIEFIAVADSKFVKGDQVTVDLYPFGAAS